MRARRVDVLLLSLPFLLGAGDARPQARAMDDDHGRRFDLASVSDDGAQGNNDSDRAALSADGRYVAFASIADNLVPGDTNLWYDVFVRDRVSGTTLRVSVGPGGVQANSGSGNYGPAISANGQHVAFDSTATNLVAGDTNKVIDVFVRVNFAG
jgi:Tol biopolymer transport system component